MEALESKRFDIERLERVKDVFIFCCYTGLAHIDVEKLTPDNIVIGIDGKKWIYTFRGENGHQIQPTFTACRYQHYTKIPLSSILFGKQPPVTSDHQH